MPYWWPDALFHSLVMFPVWCAWHSYTSISLYLVAVLQGVFVFFNFQSQTFPFYHFWYLFAQSVSAIRTWKGHESKDMVTQVSIFCKSPRQDLIGSKFDIRSPTWGGDEFCTPAQMVFNFACGWTWSLGERGYQKPTFLWKFFWIEKKQGAFFVNLPGYCFLCLGRRKKHATWNNEDIFFMNHSNCNSPCWSNFTWGFPHSSHVWLGAPAVWWCPAAQWLLCTWQTDWWRQLVMIMTNYAICILCKAGEPITIDLLVRACACLVA